MRKHNLRNVICLLALTSMVMTACGTENADEQETVSPEVQEEQQVPEREDETVVSEETAEVEEEPVVEESAEPTVEEMTVGEWVESLNLTKPAFLVVNELTGVKIALEEAQEYKPAYGDFVIIFMPEGFEITETICQGPAFKGKKLIDGYLVEEYYFEEMTDNQKVEYEYSEYSNKAGETGTFSCIFVK